MSLKITNFNISIKGKNTLLSNLNISLEKKQIIVIQGKSGCGKSTLLRAVAGFIRLETTGKKTNIFTPQRKWFDNNENIVCTGNIFLENELLNNLDPRNRSMGYLMQGSRIYPHLKTPRDVLEFPYKINKQLQSKLSQKEYSENAYNIFCQLNFNIDYEGKIENLSGGEEQRLLLAKCLLISPRILLLDEPFSNLDFIQREEIRTILKEIIQDQSNTIEYIIMVSHDINDGKIADKILLFNDNNHSQMKNNYNIIGKNSYETAFDTYSRKHGNWTDKNNKVCKNNIITEIISKSSNKDLYEDIFNGFFDTFNISKSRREVFYKEISSNNFNSDFQFEEKVKDILGHFNKSLYNETLSTRADTIYNEIRPYLDSTSILDVGCGDGRVAKLISDDLMNTKIELTDIYYHNDIKKISLPFKRMKDDITLPYDDKSFETSLLLTVLHHSDNPTEILKEVSRVSKNRIIIIESVLGISYTNQGEFNRHNDKRLEYARLVDWVYNRIVYDGINVPYNFLCVEDWLQVFEQLDLTLVAGIDLGIDIEVVPEHHYLFILDK